mmetsp:Transcript_6609/g.12748  ORF Transcript_6609/g.12748 Transcript_6609/m.12748 type:complete len:370 (+) Transcript_6609:172-1281(+)
MCLFYMTPRLSKWCRSLTCDDVFVSPLKFLMKLVVALPVTLLLIIYALSLSLCKWPKPSYMSMRDSYEHFKGVMKEGAKSYEDEEQGRRREVNDPFGLDRCGKQCAAECYCLLSPLFVLYWLTLPVQILASLLVLTVVCSAPFKGAEVVFPQRTDSRPWREIWEGQLVVLDEETSMIAFGNKAEMRLKPPAVAVAREATVVVPGVGGGGGPPPPFAPNAAPGGPQQHAFAKVPPPPPRGLAAPVASAQSDEELARILQRQEDDAYANPNNGNNNNGNINVPPLGASQSGAGGVSRSEVDVRAERIAERQRQVLEGSARVARGLFTAAKFGAGVMAKAGREAKKAYDDKRREEEQRRQQQVPTAVAYPVP